jgi:hypothetical protein
MIKEIFKKDYDGESIVDMGRDISESLDERYNPDARVIPSDEHGFAQGTFTVTIEWEPDSL